MPIGSRSLDSLRFAARISVLAHYLGLLAGAVGGPDLRARGGRLGKPVDPTWRSTDLAVGRRSRRARGARLEVGRRAELQRNEALVLTALAFGIWLVRRSDPAHRLRDGSAGCLVRVRLGSDHDGSEHAGVRRDASGRPALRARLAPVDRRARRPRAGPCAHRDAGRLGAAHGLRLAGGR